MDRFKMLVKKSEIFSISEKIIKIRDEVVEFPRVIAGITVETSEIEQRLSDVISFFNTTLDDNTECYDGDEEAFAWCEITFSREYVCGKRKLIFNSQLKDVLMQLGAVKDKLMELAISLNEERFLDIARETTELISYVLVVTNPIYQQL